MFKEPRRESGFEWSMLGDLTAGRPNLGPMTNVSVYRLMQFTLRDVLIQEFDPATADRLYYKAGELAGKQFFGNLVTERKDLAGFLRELQELLGALKIGILRVEESDPERLAFTLTVAEDLDCSGLPVCEETICTYDEGFLAGLLEAFSGRRFEVKEKDCWCSGDRVCRFKASPA